MDEDQRALIRRLFVLATEVVEAAHAQAIRGQSQKMGAGDYAACGRRLQAAAHDLQVIAEAAMVAVRRDVTAAGESSDPVS